MKVAIIGAGLIGRAWAIVFARGGADVSLFDQNEMQCQAALDWVDNALAAMTEFELIDDAAAVRGKIKVATTLSDAVGDADYIQENIVERPEPKQAIFVEIEKLARPDSIFASSSSAIMPSIIFGGLRTRSRCLVAHPMNPPHLAPVIELCGSDFTDKAVLEKTSHFMTVCGMSVVKVEKEVEGFVLNRLQFAVLNEAFRLIESGVVSVAGLEKTLKDGLALRWSFMGPIETMDLNAPQGVADYMSRYGETVRRGGDLQRLSTQWTPEITGALEAACRAIRGTDELADAQAWRDRRLMALLQHKKNAAS